MRYQIVHRTHYRYRGAVTVSHHLARLSPRRLPHQSCPWHQIEIGPVPVGRWAHVDAFGNQATYFEIEGSHHSLEVTARSLVDVRPPPRADAAAAPPWERVREDCLSYRLTPTSQAGVFRFASPRVPLGSEFARYAAEDFLPERPILEALCALNERIYHDFAFDTVATDVATPVADVFRRRAGVCQDFAHVMLACLRSLGLPARYVSGYLETVPPPGQVRLEGADASHAWVALFCGEEIGWVDADPTNRMLPSDRHITTAWGRDFADVSPLRGVTLGGGGEELDVAVDVVPLEAPADS